MSNFPSANGKLSRRGFLSLAATGAASLGLSACATVDTGPAYVEAPPAEGPGASYGSYVTMYAPVFDEGFQIPAVPIERMDPQFLRQVVPDPTGEPAGTIIVDTSQHFLYLVLGNGRAMRYGVGLGRQGFEWSGQGVIEWKQHWPRWHPPEEMIERQPELEKYRTEYDPVTREWKGGMGPGIGNPLGARALYIYQDGKDTLYRLHGSPEWYSIGKSTSSGCVRLINQDVIDLYDRVAEKSPIVVTSGLRVT